MFRLFRKTETLISGIDEFLGALDEGMLVYRQGVQYYLSGNQVDFLDALNQIRRLEERADTFRRQVRSDMYSFSLLPEYRADILELLEKLDDIIDAAKDSLSQFNIEKPFIPEVLHEDIVRLIKVAGKAAENIILAARAFFQDVKLVNDRLHRVYYYEREADDLGERIKTRLFQEMDDIHLSNKQQIRYFVGHIDRVADISEGVADLLTIFAIQRMI